MLGHLDCDEKSNEIPAVQTLLASLALTGSVVTVDAMHCQKKHFEQAAAASVHLIAQVKANQPALHHAIAALCDTAAPVDSTQTADKKRRCRDETRTVEVFAPGGSFGQTPSGMASDPVRLSASIATHLSPAPPPLGYGAIPARPPCSSATLCCQPLNVPKPSVTTGTSRIARTTSVTEASPRTPAASAAILASLPVCARSLPASQRFNGIHNVSDGRHRIAFGGISAILAMRVMY